MDSAVQRRPSRVEGPELQKEQLVTPIKKVAPCMAKRPPNR